MEGGFVSSPTASLVFLAIGAGAIFQVVVAIGRFIIHSGGGSLMAGHRPCNRYADNVSHRAADLK
jgi:hypothetical protein